MTDIVEIDSDNTVVVEEVDVEVIESTNGDVIVTEEKDTLIIAIAEQGPPGISGELVAYAKRSEILGDVIYKGVAMPGSNDADPVWQISRVVIADVIEEKFANGLGDYSNVWNNRSALTYL